MNRRPLAYGVVAVLATTLLNVQAAPAAHAAQPIGYPTFTGSAIPAPPW